MVDLNLTTEQAQNLLNYLNGQKSDPGIISDIKRMLETALAE